MTCRCVVWTGDGRVFFYNPSTRTSVWERPEDLLGRPDVDKAISTTPEQLLSTVPKDENKAAPEATVVAMELAKKRPDSESSEEDEAEVANKKQKLDPVSAGKRSRDKMGHNRTVDSNVSLNYQFNRPPNNLKRNRTSAKKPPWKLRYELQEKEHWSH